MAAALALAAVAATAQPPPEELCPGYFGLGPNASYWDFNALGQWSPAKERARSPLESMIFIEAVEAAPPDLIVMDLNT